jgi:EAL domain-containing protein (putative c-di-GMP-specific phosphodiesterase class I)
VAAVIQLVRGVECELVAEAVETVAQADILRTMGCETIQGFVFAQPMMEREFLAWTAHAELEGRNAA